VLEIFSNIADGGAIIKRNELVFHTMICDGKYIYQEGIKQTHNNEDKNKDNEYFRPIFNVKILHRD